MNANQYEVIVLDRGYGTYDTYLMNSEGIYRQIDCYADNTAAAGGAMAALKLAGADVEITWLHIPRS